MEPISMAAVGAAVKAVVDLAKGVDKSELRGELQGAINDLQSTIFELQSKIGSLMDENRSLKEAAALNDMDLREDGMLWDGDDGPFCPKCIPEGVRARVSQNPVNGFWVCNVCQRSPVGAPQPKDW